MAKTWPRVVRGAVFFVCMVLAVPSFAADSFSLISVHPNPDLGTYFFVQESKGLPQFKWTLGLFTLYYNQLLNADLETGVRGRREDREVSQRRAGLNHLLYQYLYGGFGITDRLSLMFDMPFFWYYKLGVTSGGVTDVDWHRLSPGDIRLFGKATLLDLDRYPVGLAFIPSVSFPTGKDEHFLGDDGVTAEMALVAEVRPIDKFSMAFNTSFQTRKKVVLNDVSFRDFIKFSLGANYRIEPNLSLIAELETQTAANNAFGSKKTTPAEARFGVRWWPKGERWMLGAGGSAGIIYGRGMPRFAGFINFGYSSVAPKAPAEPKPEVPVEEVPPEEVPVEKAPPPPPEPEPKEVPVEKAPPPPVEKAPPEEAPPPPIREVTEVPVRKAPPPPPPPPVEEPKPEVPVEKIPKEKVPVEEPKPEVPVVEAPPKIPVEKVPPPPVKKPKPRKPVVKEEAICVYVTEYEIYFGFDHSRLSPEARSILNDVIEFISGQEGTAVIELRGWTDPIGTVEYNKDLSLRRARATADYIRQLAAQKNVKVLVIALGIGIDYISPPAEGRRTDIVVKGFLDDIPFGCRLSAKFNCPLAPIRFSSSCLEFFRTAKCRRVISRHSRRLFKTFR